MHPYDALEFGPYRLLPERRALLDGDAPLRLGSRAFDILVHLTARAGTVVPNEELIASVWPNSVVDPGSLRVHVSALRKALGDGRSGHRYIANVPMKGYSFVAPVRRLHSAEPRPAEGATLAVVATGGTASLAAAPVASSSAVSGTPSGSAALPTAPQPTPQPAPANASLHPPLTRGLPALLTRPVGRDALVADLVVQLPQRRCLTLVGAGGIGKTTVALAVATELAARYAHGAGIVELAPLADPALVPTALASALGVVVPPAEPTLGLVAFLRDKQMLIVLDNCEHLIDAVATLAEALMGAAPGVHLLATSREPLRIHGEWVQRVSPLPAPPRAAPMDARAVQAFAAVELFVERARATLDDFDLRDEDVPAITEICHRLDGMPLAIELAAASIEQLGIAGLATQLAERLSFLTRGRRTALPRHQTLRATLDWSHELLSDGERTALRRLAIFKSPFLLPAALAIAADPDAGEHVAGLVGKSLLVADISGEVVVYRLLEVTREYGLQKLAAAGEAEAWARRHAEYLVAELRRSALAPGQPLPPHRLELQARSLDDLRAAARWAFSPQGDAALGIALAAQAAPLWFALSLLAEYRQLAEQALAAVEADPQLADALRLHQEMALREAHGHSLWHTRGSGTAMAAAFTRALALAQQLGETAFQLRSVWGLWLICNTTGNYAGSVRLAEQFGSIAATAPPDTANSLTHDRMMALGLHFHGEQATARVHALRVLEHPLTVNHVARNSGFQFDQRVAALAVLARISWIHGFPDQALRYAHEAVTEAEAIGHALSLCYAIANGAAPVAFWAGDRPLARRYTELLMQRATEHSLHFWQAFGEGYRLVLECADEAGSRQKRPRDTLTGSGVNTLLLETLCTIDARLVDEAVLARAETGETGWCGAELMRVKALQWLREHSVSPCATACATASTTANANATAAATGPATGAADATATADAQAWLLRGLALARGQQALSWELRCADSLARLWRHEGRVGEARELLSAVLLRFTEGLATADLLRAGALLRELAEAEQAC